MSEMVISVPHSGTRSLREHLGVDGYWHFGQNDPDIAQFTGLAHIPIRDRFDISMSWEARYPREEHKGADELIRRLEMMIEYRGERKYWKIDDIPSHVGKGPEHWGRKKKNRAKARELERSLALVRWYRGSQAAQDFYARFFEGFWWA